CGLLHDVGHGPFGHKFDGSFLEIKFDGLNHEKIGSKIIEEKLGYIIEGIRRSPSGFFNESEIIKPLHISYVINKSARYNDSYPKWLKALRALFCGRFFTVDNLDYVLRDSYFAGYSRDPLKIDRILFYTSINQEGLIFASPGKNTFKQFINLKTDLYNSIYFHRTVRAIDLAIDSVFYKTMEKICNFNPLEKLDKYLNITEWDLLHICKNWVNSKNQNEKELGIKWCKILNREKIWYIAFDREIKISYSQNSESLFFSQFINIKEIENKIYAALKAKFIKENIEDIAISIDTPSLDPRPFDVSLEEKMKIFNNNIGIIEEKRIFEWISDVPIRIINFRVYTNKKDYIKVIAEISESLVSRFIPSSSTNI
ncbi:MAG: HD domain-containing protein, partial [Candidatus Staskawiczbacteria bacterium]|nr:HD domain-containing protein [Candidatus Staskawiczbacteria bacterium]